jgi:hypothetical protein
VEKKNPVILFDSDSDASEAEENARGGAPTPPPPSSPSPPLQQKKKSSTELVLQVETEHGTHEMSIPGSGTTKYDLRDRCTLKKNVRFQANHCQAIQGENKEEWTKAINDEYESLMKNKTWEIVPKPKFSKILDGRWLFKVKTNADGSLERFKARYVIKGFKARLQGFFAHPSGTNLKSFGFVRKSKSFTGICS